RDFHVTGVQTCALPICRARAPRAPLHGPVTVDACDPAVSLRCAVARGHADPGASPPSANEARATRARPSRNVSRNASSLEERLEIGRASCREREPLAGV